MYRFSFFGFTTQFRFRQSIRIQFKFNSSRCSLHQNSIHDSIQPSKFHLNSVHNSIQLSKLHFKSIHNLIPLNSGHGVFWQISPLRPFPILVGYTILPIQLEMEPQPQCCQVLLVPTDRMQMCSKGRKYIVETRTVAYAMLKNLSGLHCICDYP